MFNKCHIIIVILLISFSRHTSAQIPQTPYLSSPPNGATDVSLRPTLDWSTVVPHASYVLEVYDNSTGTKIYDYDGGVSNRTIDDYPLLENEGTYKWRVKAYNNYGETDWTDYWYFTCAPLGVPELISPADDATGVSITPTLSWTETSGVHKYVLWYKIKTSSVWEFPYPETQATTIQIGPLNYNTEYQWYIRAFGHPEWRATEHWFFTTLKLADPVVDFYATPTSGPVPLTVQFTDQTIGNLSSHQWEFGDGTMSPATNPSHTYQNPGTYTVTLSVERFEDGSDFYKIRADYITVYSESSPIANFSASPTTGPAPLTVQFTDQTTGNDTGRLWDLGDETTSTSANPLHIYQNPGIYTVKLTVTGPGGSDTKIRTDLIHVLSNEEKKHSHFQRGVNLANWFENFNSISEIHFKLYTKKDFENIKTLGFDHIRLPVEFFDMTGPAPDYALDPLLFKLLDQIIDWAEELDLHLILDNHSWDPLIDTDPNINNQLVAVWKQLADHYKNRSNLVYYEILNEPHGISDAVWHNMQQQAINAIRAYDQTHTIIVGPANWNNYNNLKYMPEFADANLIYTFHFYEPHIFTNQGTAWGNPSMENLTEVPYPYDAARMPDLPAELIGTWIENRYNAYPEECNDTWIRSQIDIAKQFMNERHVPLWCGEFGVYMLVSQTEDRARWLETVRTYFEANGIAWTHHEYSGDFGIFESGSHQLFENDINIPIIEALGLTPPPQREYQFLADSTGFTIYDDYISQGIFKNNWLSVDDVDYYSQSNPAEGDFCISWQGSNLYDCLRFRFFPLHDLTLLEPSDYLLGMWIRCSKENVRLDIRFEDTDTDTPDDHPWRMRFIIDNTVVDWDGTWQHLLIPLTDFTEHGAYEDNTWYNPQGDFDWSQVEHFIIDAQYHDLNDVELFFDQICIIEPSEPSAVNITKPLSPKTAELPLAYPNPFNPTTTIEYNLSKAANVLIVIYNPLGRHVKTLVNTRRSAGNFQTIWDGTDEYDLPVVAGVYFCRMETVEFVNVTKLLLIK